MSGTHPEWVRGEPHPDCKPGARGYTYKKDTRCQLCVTDHNRGTGVVWRFAEYTLRSDRIEVLVFQNPSGLADNDSEACEQASQEIRRMIERGQRRGR